MDSCVEAALRDQPAEGRSYYAQRNFGPERAQKRKDEVEFRRNMALERSTLACRRVTLEHCA
jgi:hypothetical protein